MVKHSFHLKADWPGGRNSTGYIESKYLQTKVSIPPEMEGPGIGTNPDEMLLGAAATRYVITLAAMIERASLPLNEISLTSEGIVDVTYGVSTHKTIIHRPHIDLNITATHNNYKNLSELIEKADKSCMISRALKGNVTIELQPTIE